MRTCSSISLMCPHTSIYVVSYLCICGSDVARVRQLKLYVNICDVCGRILMYTPHYTSSYCCILLYKCPHAPTPALLAPYTTTYVLVLILVHELVQMCSCHYICVLLLLTNVLLPLYMCPHAPCFISLARNSLRVSPVLFAGVC
jgi:hypothetical protein